LRSWRCRKLREFREMGERRSERSKGADSLDMKNRDFCIIQGFVIKNSKMFLFHFLG